MSINPRVAQLLGAAGKKAKTVREEDNEDDGEGDYEGEEDDDDSGDDAEDAKQFDEAVKRQSFSTTPVRRTSALMLFQTAATGKSFTGTTLTVDDAPPSPIPPPPSTTPPPDTAATTATAAAAAAPEPTAVPATTPGPLGSGLPPAQSPVVEPTVASTQSLPPVVESNTVAAVAGPPVASSTTSSSGATTTTPTPASVSSHVTGLPPRRPGDAIAVTLAAHPNGVDLSIGVTSSAGSTSSAPSTPPLKARSTPPSPVIAAISIAPSAPVTATTGSAPQSPIPPPPNTPPPARTTPITTVGSPSAATLASLEAAPLVITAESPAGTVTQRSLSETSTTSTLSTSVPAGQPSLLLTESALTGLPTTAASANSNSSNSSKDNVGSPERGTFRKSPSSPAGAGGVTFDFASSGGAASPPSNPVSSPVTVTLSVTSSLPLPTGGAAIAITPAAPPRSTSLVCENGCANPAAVDCFDCTSEQRLCGSCDAIIHRGPTRSKHRRQTVTVPAGTTAATMPPPSSLTVPASSPVGGSSVLPEPSPVASVVVAAAVAAASSTAPTPAPTPSGAVTVELITPATPATPVTPSTPATPAVPATPPPTPAVVSVTPAPTPVSAASTPAPVAATPAPTPVSATPTPAPTPAAATTTSSAAFSTPVVLQQAPEKVLSLAATPLSSPPAANLTVTTSSTHAPAGATTPTAAATVAPGAPPSPMLRQSGSAGTAGPAHDPNQPPPSPNPGGSRVTVTFRRPGQGTGTLPSPAGPRPSATPGTPSQGPMSLAAGGVASPLNLNAPAAATASSVASPARGSVMTATPVPVSPSVTPVTVTASPASPRPSANPNQPSSGSFAPRASSGSVSASSSTLTAAVSSSPHTLERKSSINGAGADDAGDVAGALPSSRSFERSGSMIGGRYLATGADGKRNSVFGGHHRRAGSGVGAQLGLPAQPATPGNKTKCAHPKCMAFAAKGEWCLRHQWKALIMPDDSVPLENSKQYNVANEILSTEKSYCNGLKTAVSSFLLRLRALVDLGRPLLPLADIEKVFHNIEDLYKLSFSLSSDLEEIKTERVMLEQISTTLLHYAPQFRLYQPYLENYDDAIKSLGALRKSNEPFDFFVKWTERCEGMSLESFLILPIQRLPRYMLLLTELRRNTNAEDPSMIDIGQALEKVKAITDAINQSLHQKEAVEKVRLLQGQFERDSRYMDLVTPTRALVKDGPLKKHFSKLSRHLSDTKVYHFFLFNDILLYASSSRNFKGQVSYKLKHFYPLLEMVCEQFAVDPKKSSSVRQAETDLKIKTSAKHHFVISCADRDDKKEWFEAIAGEIARVKGDAKSLKVVSYDGNSTRASINSKNSKLQSLMGV